MASPSATAQAKVREMVDLRHQCKICETGIIIGELCAKCAEGNDPFFTCDNSGTDLMK